MRKILIILFLLSVSGSLYAQKLPEISYNVRIAEPDRTIRAEIKPVSTSLKAKPGLLYYWYSANVIHSTEGGYSGNLLNGPYYEYYLNKNLKEQGAFKNGLKNGTWKTWNEGGTLNNMINWKKGIIVPDNKHSFWQRVNIFRKREETAAVDSVAKKPQ